MLGEGGAKRVYLAYDTRLDRDVAFALIKTEHVDIAGLDRIQREAQAMGRLGDHPHIVGVYDTGEDEGRPFIVSRFMAGGDLAALLDRTEGHRLPLAQALHVAEHVCRALAFAHAHGIVHRDIKPDNVWLTAEGDACLGDFGIAVALERPRLTQTAMIIGTAAYLSPEQALGGDVTPRSDLYSLGAMLYELVTGRLPFLGDDFVTVISQHLNTAPVAPSWHNPEIPADLEDLIVRLLEKDPLRRPASADDVRETLAQIAASPPSLRGIGAAGAEATRLGANPLERLARGVFVGRERELARLRAAFDEALTGRGGVVMLVGEPGIGKTRTTQELETYARLRGAQVLWGRAHESAGAPAYWPWVQALRAYMAAAEPADLRAQLGNGAAEVGRIVSEVRERLPGLPEAPAVAEPEAAQFRLFDAIARFLKNATQSAPLVLVLDDLHWADKPTLLLLQYVAREIGRSRLLLVGTYRDVEVGRAHPLAAMLAELARERLFERVLLRGLNREEVETYIRASAGVDPTRELVAAIFSETEGNPFFLAEVVALLAQEGRLADRGRAGAPGIAVEVPQSVREVLGRRLNRLSDDCNVLLTLAAVAGRDFRYDLLAEVSGHDEERLLALLEEAIDGRLIEEIGAAGQYRFTHALVQETLLGELSTTRTVRLHGQIGEALERLYVDRSESQAAELARHFVESATLTRGHAGKAVRYSRLAAEQAEAATAWDEAMRHYQRCLTVMAEAGDPFGKDDAALLTAFGRCARNFGEPRPGWRSLMRARDLYRTRDDAVGLAHATLEAAQYVAPPERLRALLDDALAALGARDPSLEARLLVMQLRLAGQGKAMPGSGEEWHAMFGRASELIDAHGLSEIEADLLEVRADRADAEGRLDEALALMRAAHERYAGSGRHEQAAFALLRLTNMICLRGRLDAGLEAAELALGYTRRVHVATPQRGIRLRQGAMLYARCDFATFLEVVEEARRIPGNQIFIHILEASDREMRGDLETAVAALPPHELSGGVPMYQSGVHGLRARVFFNAGDDQAARAELALWAESGGGEPYEIDECLPALGDEALVRREYELLTAGLGGQYRLGWSWHGLDHQRGALALRLGFMDGAERHYRAGLAWAERERCPVEQGRCLQGLAEVALRRDQRAEAKQYLDRAAALFEQHGALLYLRQVREQMTRLR